MRIEFAILAALGTMACTARADGNSPSVEDAMNMSMHVDVAPPLPVIQDIASKPTADVPLTEIANVDGLTTPTPTLRSDPCPPCGRG